MVLLCLSRCDMTVDEIRILKIKLESDMENTLNYFERRTNARMIMVLMLHIHALGYTIRGGHWFRCSDCPIGSENSVHKIKLAWDINLSLSPVDGERPRLLTGKAAEDAHNLLHDYWDSIGGGKRIEGDLNHYSIEHNGYR